MRKFIIAATLAASTAALFAADASAWERNGSVTGPRGNTFSGEAQGSCSGGTCSRSRTITGPQGNIYNRQGRVTRDGEGGYSRQGSVTGPGGNSATYGGSGQCSGGTCSYSGGRTGPAGTSTWSGSGSRY